MACGYTIFTLTVIWRKSRNLIPFLSKRFGGFRIYDLVKFPYRSNPDSDFNLINRYSGDTSDGVNNDFLSQLKFCARI